MSSTLDIVYSDIVEYGAVADADAASVNGLLANANCYAINLALSSAKHVLFPAGVFTFRGPITFGADDARCLFLAGAILRPYDKTSKIVISGAGQHITGLYVDATECDAHSPLVDIYGASALVMEGLRVETDSIITPGTGPKAAVRVMYLSGCRFIGGRLSGASESETVGLWLANSYDYDYVGAPNSSPGEWMDTYPTAEAKLAAKLTSGAREVGAWGLAIEGFGWGARIGCDCDTVCFLECRFVENVDGAVLVRDDADVVPTPDATFEVDGEIYTQATPSEVAGLNLIDTHFNGSPPQFVEVDSGCRWAGGVVLGCVFGDLASPESDTLSSAADAADDGASDAAGGANLSSTSEATVSAADGAPHPNLGGRSTDGAPPPGTVSTATGGTGATAAPSILPAWSPASCAGLLGADSTTSSGAPATSLALVAVAQESGPTGSRVLTSPSRWLLKPESSSDPALDATGGRIVAGVDGAITEAAPAIGGTGPLTHGAAAAMPSPGSAPAGIKALGRVGGSGRQAGSTTPSPPTAKAPRVGGFGLPRRPRRGAAIHDLFPSLTGGGAFSSPTSRGKTTAVRAGRSLAVKGDGSPAEESRVHAGLNNGFGSVLLRCIFRIWGEAEGVAVSGCVSDVGPLWVWLTGDEASGSTAALPKVGDAFNAWAQDITREGEVASPVIVAADEAGGLSIGAESLTLASNNLGFLGSTTGAQDSTPFTRSFASAYELGSGNASEVLSQLLSDLAALGLVKVSA